MAEKNRASNGERQHQALNNDLILQMYATIRERAPLMAEIYESLMWGFETRRQYVIAARQMGANKAEANVIAELYFALPNESITLLWTLGLDEDGKPLKQKKEVKEE